MKLKNFLPILEWIPDYRSGTFRKDLIAGLTVSIMLVPQGMAYAYLAGMPPIYGLYGGLVPLIFYAIFGTSRYLSIGPVAISALLLLAGVKQLANPASSEYISLVLLAGLLIGLFQILLSLFRMGFLINFLSHPVIAGFTSAATIIIAVTQLRDLLGISIPRFSHSYETVNYALSHIAQSNWIALVTGLGSLLIIIGLRYVKKSLPSALIVVVLATFLSWLLQLEQHGLDVIGQVPKGLPSWQIPEITWERIQRLLPTVFTVTIIGIVESIGIAKALEARFQNHIVRPNQELMALGLSKVFGAFFQALPTSGSFSRSAVNSDAGARTQVSSLVTAGVIALTLVFFTPMFYYLPKAVLAAIIFVALANLFDLKEAIYLWHCHRSDFYMMLVTFILTLALGIETGVLSGVILSIVIVLYRSSRPHVAVLGKLPGTTHYRNINRFEQAQDHDDILIVRFDDQLYFGNASYFKDTIKGLVKEKGTTLKLLILDASSMHDLDSSGLHALEEIHDYLGAHGVDLYLSGVIGPVRDMFYKSRFTNAIGKKNQFMYIQDAINFYQQKKNGMEDAPWSQHALQTNILKDDSKGDEK